MDHPRGTNSGSGESTVVTLPGLEPKELRAAAAALRKLVPVTSDRVLINVNLVSWDDYPFTTAIDLLEAVVEAFDGVRLELVAGPAVDKCTVFEAREQPLDIQIAESRRFIASLRECTEFAVFSSRYQEHAQRIERYLQYLKHETPIARRAAALGLPFTVLGSGDTVQYELLETSEGRFPVFDLRAYGTILNLPVVKRHTSLGFTAAIKNFYGLIEPSYRVFFHNVSRVGAVLVALYERFLREHRIVTCADARKIPDGQQLYWVGSATICSPGIFYVSDDCAALDRRIARDMFSNVPAPRDPTFVEWLSRAEMGSTSH